MHPKHHAARDPHKPALIMAFSGEIVTYGELDARSNQSAQLFRHAGLVKGDVIAILMENEARFFEIAWGAQRSGLYYTCISSRLTPGEVRYILGDSGAKALIVSQSLLGLAEAALNDGPHIANLWLVGTGSTPNDAWSDFLAARAAMPASPIADEAPGSDMLYSSGTTGRPKGIKPLLPQAAIDSENPLTIMTRVLYGANADTIYLSPAPLYHAAPLRWTMTMMRHGATCIIMEEFQPEALLQLIEAYGVTAAQMVPTMFVKLLKLPEAARSRYNVSSLKMAIHAAAPCPIPVKEQMIAWWGPVIFEYYAGTEGNGYCSISSAEWLTHKGSVGKAMLGEIHILDDAGEELGPDQHGTIYFGNGPNFEYHNDPDKTAAARSAQGWSTLGDIGFVDEEGYLFLTDRKAHMIISGGVNIYPQEAENILITHPKVADVAVIGVPNEEFGESVKAVVQPLNWSDAGEGLEAELLAFCRSQLAPIKCPRSVDFAPELPRHPTGKLYKRLIRDQYWQGRESKLV